MLIVLRLLVYLFFLFGGRSKRSVDFRQRQPSAKQVFVKRERFVEVFPYFVMRPPGVVSQGSKENRRRTHSERGEEPPWYGIEDWQWQFIRKAEPGKP
jgi:hypothetical protein